MASVIVPFKSAIALSLLAPPTVGSRGADPVTSDMSVRVSVNNLEKVDLLLQF